MVKKIEFKVIHKTGSIEAEIPKNQGNMEELAKAMIIAFIKKHSSYEDFHIGIKPTTLEGKAFVEILVTAAKEFGIRPIDDEEFGIRLIDED